MNMLLDRVAFVVFGLEIYWYGIIMASSIALAFVLVWVYCYKKKLGSDFAFSMMFATVIPGILFARLFSVLFEADTTILDYFKFREGGMSIIGAVCGGALGIALLCLIKKKNFFDVADIVVPVLILAQGIGRWGNYVNQEVFGLPVTDPKLQFFPFAVYIDSAEAMVPVGWYQALFFYESVFDILGFVLLTFLLLKVNKRGLTTGVYFLYYGILRSVLESFRSPEFILKWHGIPISQTMSLVMVLLGTAILTKFVAEAIANKRNQNKTKPKEVGEK